MPGESVGFLRQTSEPASCCLFNKSDNSVRIAVADRDSGRELGNRADCRADVKEGRADPANVVHLGWMNNPHEFIPPHACMQIRRRTRRRKFIERLVRNALHVLKTMLAGEFPHPGKLATAADEAERDLVIIPKPSRGLEQCIERMTWTVVA